jgi:twinkle protein
MLDRTNPPRHGQRGYYSLADLPQQPSVSSSAIGTGWWEMDQIFKLYGGQLVLMTGVAGSGKSTFLFNLLINVAREYGVRSFMYVPENEAHVRDALRKIWSGNDAGFDQFCKHECFIQSAEPDAYDSRPQDLPWVLDQAVAAIERDGVSLLLIDPWNEIEHAKPAQMLMTDYIRQCLMYLKQFCRAHNVTVVLVAHPTKAVAENGGRDPKLSDIEGSMNWWNKCDNGLVLVRKEGTNTTLVKSEKVRERGAGKVGTCHFFVDPETGRFTPQVGGVY